MTYTTPGSWPGPLVYQLSVSYGGAYIGTNVGNDQISGSSVTKNGSFTGAFNYLYMSACAFHSYGQWGYAWVTASW
jgi:hypothetical protein